MLLATAQEAVFILLCVFKETLRQLIRQGFDVDTCVTQRLTKTVSRHCIVGSKGFFPQHIIKPFNIKFASKCSDGALCFISQMLYCKLRSRTQQKVRAAHPMSKNCHFSAYQLR